MRSTHAISSSTTPLYVNITNHYSVGRTLKYICRSLSSRQDTPECGGSSHLSPPDTCNARGHSPNSLVPHAPAYHLRFVSSPVPPWRVSFACSGSWQVTKPLGIRGILTSSLQCQMPPSGEPGRGLPVAGEEDAGMLADLVSVESVQCLASV